MENFLAVFFTVMITDFVAEFGDKTQLLLIGMTSKYKIRDIVLGTLVAVLVLNGIAVFIGGALNELLNSFLWAVKFVAAAAFIYFAVTTLKSDDDEDEEEKPFDYNEFFNEINPTVNDAGYDSGFVPDSEDM